MLRLGILIIIIFNSQAFSSALDSNISKAITNMKCQNWQQANKYAKLANVSAIKKLVTSQQLLDNNEKNSFNKIVDFLTNNPQWPEYDAIKAQAERSINDSSARNLLLKWFDLNPPNQTKTSVIYLNNVDAEFKQLKKPTDKEIDKYTNTIKNVWIRASFDNKGEKEFISKYKSYLTYKDFYNKIEELLWNNNLSGAVRLIPYMKKNDQEMFVAQIAIKEKKANLEQLFSRLPNEQKYKSGILYSYIKHHHELDPDKDITPLILKAPHDNQHAHPWWRLKAYYIREYIKEGKYNAALAIAQNHHAVNLADTVDAHWLAGWISLNYLNNPKQALIHFTKLYQRVGYPISLSRGAYWQAECYSRLGNQAQARKWYKVAAEYPTTFYGQLARSKLTNYKLNLELIPIINGEHIKQHSKNDIAVAAKYLMLNNYNSLALKYIKSAISQAKSPAEIVLLVEMSKKYGTPEILVEAAKSASHKNVLITKYNYPTPYKIPVKLIEDAFTYSIIRQESVFNPKAVSCANAMGLMQLIEPTAIKAAKSLGIKYSKSLLFKPDYNIKLGTQNLKLMTEAFKGSYIMAAAAYNAGPGPVNKWIELNGDPRQMQHVDEIVHWIEAIPYYETRNYVMRVLENIQVYRYILDKNSKLQIEKDLKRRTAI